MKKITAILLSALMLIGMFGMVANAETADGTSDPVEAITVTKYLKMDGEVTDYPQFTFDILFKQLTFAEIPDGVKNILGDEETLYGTFQKPITVTISPEVQTGLTANKDTTREIKTEVSYAVSAAQYQNKPGLYVYKVNEKELVDNWGESWIKKTDEDKVFPGGEEYYLCISVSRVGTTDEYIVDSAQVFKWSEDKDAYEKTTLDFVNQYQRGDEKDDEGIYITKIVTGNRSVSTDKFKFTMTAKKNVTDTAESYTGTIYNVTVATDGTITKGNPTGRNVTVKLDGTATEQFELGNNEALVFDNFPVGTDYTVTEQEDIKGYTPSYKYTNGGTTTSSPTEGIEAGDALSTPELSVKEGDNFVNYTNEKNIVVTGIVTDNLSFVLSIVVAAVGMTAYVAMKRRFRTF